MMVGRAALFQNRYENGREVKSIHECVQWGMLAPLGCSFYEQSLVERANVGRGEHYL
jgi:hypothetical protein